jgi:hypothetical protein
MDVACCKIAVLLKHSGQGYKQLGFTKLTKHHLFELYMEETNGTTRFSVDNNWKLITE